MVKLALAAFTLCQVFFMSLTHAAPSKEEYELQERCGKRADDWFRKTWGDGTVKGNAGIATYRNHYSPAQNKCFVLLTYQSYNEKSKRARPVPAFAL